MIAIAGAVTLLLALLGAPLFAVIAANALIAFYSVDIDSSALGIELYRLANMPMLMTIPLFTFAGCLLSQGKTPHRLVRLSRAMLGWLPGGLAIVALVACALFTAFTGATGVTIVALGGLLYPALQQDKYSEKFSLGLVTTSGSLGLLFAPSLPLILYGIVSQAEIGKLFKAGLLPGVLMLVLLAVYSMAVGMRQRAARKQTSLKEVASALWEVKWEAPLPFVVLGGIYSGFFALSDAAAVTALYALVAEVLIYRDVPLRDLPKVLRQTAVLVGGIMIIMGVALGYTNYLIDEEVPMQILESIQEHISSRFGFLIMLNVFLLIVGCMLDIFSAILVVVPLILPIAKAYGVDPIHLGIIFLTNLQIGYCTPPIGMNLFIASYRFRKPVVRLYLSTLPFLAILFIALIIITYVPQLSLWLAGPTQAAGPLLMP